MHLFVEPEFWVLVSFIIFFVLFGRKLWAGITNLLDGHARGIRAELAEVQRLRAEAAKMLADAQRARTDAIAEAEQVLARSRVEAAQLAQAAAAEAEASGRRRERLALDRIAAAEKSALDEVRQTAADIAIGAARQVISHGIGADRETALLDGAIADLPRALRAA